MPIHYSGNRNAFLDDRVEATLPDDAVPVTTGEHTQLLDAKAAGKAIRPGLDATPTARRPTQHGEQLRTRLIVFTKREAARQIWAIAPLWRQLNDWCDLCMAEPGEKLAAMEGRVAALNAILAAFGWNSGWLV